LETFFVNEVMNHDPMVLRDNDIIVTILAKTRYATLYPVLDAYDNLLGVTTRRALMDCAQSTVASAVTQALAVSHPADTLRQVANRLAADQVARAPVVDRANPKHALGVITLAQLLHTRRRDLHEEHHRARLLAVRNGVTGQTGQA
jgi:predicted transcriptional regulator